MKTHIMTHFQCTYSEQNMEHFTHFNAVQDKFSFMLFVKGLVIFNYCLRCQRTVHLTSLSWDCT